MNGSRESFIFARNNLLLDPVIPLSLPLLDISGDRSQLSTLVLKGNSLNRVGLNRIIRISSSYSFCIIGHHSGLLIGSDRSLIILSIFHITLGVILNLLILIERMHLWDHRCLPTLLFRSWECCLSILDGIIYTFHAWNRLRVRQFHRSRHIVYLRPTDYIPRSHNSVA